MKKIFISTLKQLRDDRPAMAVVIVLLVIAIVYVTYMSLSITPVENQIAVRYTAYGNTNLYREHWYYLFSFAGFAVAIWAMHVGIIVKLLERNMRSIAVAFGWFSVLLFVIILALSRAVLSNAYFL